MDELISLIEEVRDSLESDAETAANRQELVEGQVSTLVEQLGGYDLNAEFIVLMRSAAEQYACVAATLRRASGQLEYYEELLG